MLCEASNMQVACLVTTCASLRWSDMEDSDAELADASNRHALSDSLACTSDHGSEQESDRVSEVYGSSDFQCAFLQAKSSETQASCDVSTRASDQDSEEDSHCVQEVDGSNDLQGALVEMMELLDGDAEQKVAALEALAGSTRELAFKRSTCRILQRALQVAPPDAAAALLSEMQGCVVEACMCPSANHVMQRALEVLPPSSLIFMFSELRGHAVDLARHQFGCRIVARIVHCVHTSHEACVVIEEVLAKVAHLTNHKYGSLVIQAIVQHGLAPHVAVVARSLIGRAVQHAISRACFHLVLLAMECLHGAEREELVEELFGSADALIILGESQFGCRVAKTYLELPLARPELLSRFLKQVQPRLRKSKYGKRLLAKLEKSQ